MSIRLAVGVTALLLSGSCRARAPAGPETSALCSSAYPNGIAQEDREHNPPHFRVKHTLDEDLSGKEHFMIALRRAGESSGTTFELTYGEAPHLIFDMAIQQVGEAYELGAKVWGREDMRAGQIADDGPAQAARVLFTFVVEPLYTSYVPVLESAAAIAEHYISDGWTCDGGYPIVNERRTPSSE